VSYEARRWTDVFCTLFAVVRFITRAVDAAIPSFASGGTGRTGPSPRFTRWFVKSVVRVAGTCVSVFGILLLVRVLVESADGSLPRKFFPQAQESWIITAAALMLSLPVPFHVISVGFVVQRRWMAAPWAKVVWWTTVISGLWLGGVLVIKWVVLR
jgi:hypothetical protein